MTGAVKHAARKHSRFAASAAKRWLACPGSVNLSKIAPPALESVYAKEGTTAHECLEFIVKRYKNLSRAIKEAEKRWPGEMIDHALHAAEEIFKLRPSPSAKLLIEKQVRLPHISKAMFGTLDYAWVEDWGTLVVIDYKYGSGVAVFPEEDDGTPNPQLGYYAVGICQEVGYDFDCVRMVVIQPRAYVEDDSTTRVADFSIRDLINFEKQLKEGYKAANQPGAPLVCGDHCRWCPALPICSEASTNTMARAGIVFDVDTNEIVAAPEAKLISLAKLPEALAACDILERWIASVRDYAHVKAMGGTEIKGFKLVETKGRRQWKEGALGKLQKKFGDSIYGERPLLSPNQLEKKHGKSAKEFTAKYADTPSGGYKLVPETDKRPKVELGAVMDVE